MPETPDDVKIDVVVLGTDAAFVLRAQPLEQGGYDIKANAAGMDPREVVSMLRSYATALERRIDAAEAAEAN